jgi:hypothetical protein
VKEENYAPEPLVGSTDEAGEMTLDILNVVQLGRQWVLDIDDEDLPVGLAFVEEGHDTEDLDLLHLSNITHLFTDLADVQRIVVTSGLCLGMLLSGILPSLYTHDSEPGGDSGGERGQ